MTQATTTSDAAARRGADRGSALLITVFVMAVMTALGTTVFVLSTKNLDNARLDRTATEALAFSEAGVAQAMAHLKYFGTDELACSPNCNGLNGVPLNSWGNKLAPYEFVVSPGEKYRIYIEPITPMNVPAGIPGVYRINSVGTVGSGPGTRTVEVDVRVEPFEFPLAVFGDTVQAGGSGALHKENLFSTGCIFKRNLIDFEGNDLVTGWPAAAVSAKFITESNSGGTSCVDGDDKNIHPNTGPTPDRYCHPAYPHDRDKLGGPLSGVCAVPTPQPQTSKIESAEAMADEYSFALEGLSKSQLRLLKTAASEQGFYIENTTQVPPVLQSDTLSAAHPNPVVFYDLTNMPTNDRTVDLNDFSALTYGRTPDDPASCHSRNVIVVVINGNLKLNSNRILVASVFAMGPSPYGAITKANGTSTLIGTMYAKSIDLTGTANVHLDDCFLDNLPGQLLDVQATSFREVDR